MRRTGSQLKPSSYTWAWPSVFNVVGWGLTVVNWILGNAIFVKINKKTSTFSERGRGGGGGKSEHRVGQNCRCGFKKKKKSVSSDFKEL